MTDKEITEQCAAGISKDVIKRVLDAHAKVFKQKPLPKNREEVLNIIYKLLNEK